MTVCRECGTSILAEARFCWSCGSSQRATSSPPRSRSSDDLLDRLRDVTAGDYEIRGEIGRGAMAAVFLGDDLHLNRPVAIKAMLSGSSFAADMPDRFRLEARIAAKLDHPNIVRVYSVKEAGNLLLFVMNFVEGRSLSEIIKITGPLDVGVTRLLVCQVARALDYAHERGVVHRDVKPANIMVDRTGMAIVADFGIAKVAESPDLTLTGVVIGTPGFISPEQVLGHPVTPASDQYSLGVVAYQMLSGVMPFRGSAVEMQWAHAKEPAPELPRPDCPPAIRAALMRMLEKDPVQRWPSMRDVHDAFATGLTAADEDAARARLVELAGGDGPPRGTVEGAGEEMNPDGMPGGPVGNTSTRPTLPWSYSDRSVGTIDASGSGAPAVADRRVSRVALAALVLALLGAGAWEAWRSAIVQPPAMRADSAAAHSAMRADSASAHSARVTPVPVAAVEIIGAPESLAAGEAVALLAAPVDAQGAPLVGRPVEWSSSDPGIAGVAGDGTVTARSAGVARITASVGGVEGSARVNVRRAPGSTEAARTTPRARPRAAPAADPPPGVLAILRTKLRLARYRTESAQYEIAADTLRSIARALESLTERYPGSAQLQSKLTEYAAALADNRRRCEEEGRMLRAQGTEAPACR